MREGPGGDSSRRYDRSQSGNLESQLLPNRTEQTESWPSSTEPVMARKFRNVWGTPPPPKMSHVDENTVVTDKVFKRCDLT